MVCITQHRLLRSAPRAATDTRAEKTQHTRRARSHRSSCRTDSARVFLVFNIASHCRSQRLPPWYRWYAVAFSRRTAHRSPLAPVAAARRCRCRCLWSCRSLLAAAAAAAATNITKRSHADCSLARRAWGWAWCARSRPPTSSRSQPALTNRARARLVSLLLPLPYFYYPFIHTAAHDSCTTSPSLRSPPPVIDGMRSCRCFCLRAAAAQPQHSLALAAPPGVAARLVPPLVAAACCSRYHCCVLLTLSDADCSLARRG
eukprot:COSAG06_NODE_3529_length_5226_cov_6.215526_2_plen_259_part_00